MADHGEHPPAKRDSTNNKDKQKPLAHQGESSLKSFIQRELFLRDNGYEGVYINIYIYIYIIYIISVSYNIMVISNDNFKW